MRKPKAKKKRRDGQVSRREKREREREAGRERRAHRKVMDRARHTQQLASEVAFHVRQILKVETTEALRQERWHGRHEALKALIEAQAIKPDLGAFVQGWLSRRPTTPLEINGVTIL